MNDPACWFAAAFQKMPVCVSYSDFLFFLIVRFTAAQCRLLSTFIHQKQRRPPAALEAIDYLRAAARQ